MYKYILIYFEFSDCVFFIYICISVNDSIIVSGSTHKESSWERTYLPCPMCEEPVQPMQVKIADNPEAEFKALAALMKD